MNDIPDHQKTAIAVFYFDGKRYRTLSVSHGPVNWEFLFQKVLKKFGNLKEESIVMEFTSIQQTSSLLDYNERYEEVRALMMVFEIEHI